MTIQKYKRFRGPNETTYIAEWRPKELCEAEPYFIIGSVWREGKGKGACSVRYHSMLGGFVLTGFDRKGDAIKALITAIGGGAGAVS